MAADLDRYVRAQDLDGEWWTIPAGTPGHRELAAWVALGNPEPVLPVEYLRHPEAGMPALELGDAIRAYLEAPDPETAHWLHRAGQYLRLRERIGGR